ncbi:MAG: LUD domain-containing protein [Saprospiraceae bacterium]
MTSKEYILNKIDKKSREEVSLPQMKLFEDNQYNLLKTFTNECISIGASVVDVKAGNHIPNVLKTLNSKVPIVDLVNKFDLDFSTNEVVDDLYGQDVVFAEGEYGIAENGGIWLDTTKMIHRGLLFSCERLVLLINRKNIILNMNILYDRIGSYDYDFGVLIAGPSKTADIEQSLVIGAQGAKELIVIIE